MAYVMKLLFFSHSHTFKFCFIQCHAFNAHQFKTKGEVCRESTDECDLPEYCNGSSGACQEDLYVINGHRCANEEWICMNGRCLSGKAQCQETFGTGKYNTMVHLVIRLDT